MRINAVTQEKIFLTDVGLPLDLDPDKLTYVEVRQASQGEVEQRAELSADGSRIFRPEGNEVRYHWNSETQKRLEVFLTLAGSNIEYEEPPNSGKFVPMFRFAVGPDRKSRFVGTEEDFKLKWNILPAEVATAVHKAVLQVNDDWDPNK